MANGVIGSIAVNVVANTGKFISDMRKSSRATKSFANDSRKSMKMSTASVVKLGGAVTAMTATTALGFKKLLSNLDEVAARIDPIAKTSAKLGIATENLIGLQHAAEQTGVSANTLNMALQRMTRRVSEAAMGTGEAKAAIKELGLDAKELNRLSPDKQFARIADAMNRVGNQSDRVRLAFKVFDSEGVALVNTTRLGSKGLGEMAAEAESLGITVNSIEAKKMEDLTDAVDRANKSWMGLKTSVALATQGVGEFTAETKEGLFKNLSTFLRFASKDLTKLKEELGLRERRAPGIGLFSRPQTSDPEAANERRKQQEQAEIRRRYVTFGAAQMKIADKQREQSVKALGQLFRRKLINPLKSDFDDLQRKIKIADPLGKIVDLNRRGGQLQQEAFTNRIKNFFKIPDEDDEASSPRRDRGVNSLVLANTRAGFNALQRNVSRASDQVQRDQLLEQKQQTQLLQDIANKDPVVFQEDDI